MLTPKEILEYAIRIEQASDVLNESLLLEAIKPEDAVKISEANDTLLGTLEKLNKAFAGKLKSLNSEIESLTTGAKNASTALKELAGPDGLKSEKFLAKLKAFFSGDSDPKAFLNSVLLLQSRAQELVEILKYSLPKIVKKIDGVQKSTESGEFDAPNAKTGLVHDVLGTTPEMGAKSIYDLLVKARPGIFKSIGNFFKGLNVSKKIIDVSKKIDYKTISEEMAVMSVKDLRDIEKGTASIKSDDGKGLQDIVKKAGEDLKSGGGKSEEGGGEEPTAEETKEAETKSDPKKAVDQAVQVASDKPTRPKDGVESALRGWHDGLSASSKGALKKKNRMGKLRDAIHVGIDKSEDAVKRAVAKSIRQWRSENEDVLIRSKQFAKKNFDSLESLIPDLVASIIKKKSEGSFNLTQGLIQNYVDDKMNDMFSFENSNLIRRIREGKAERVQQIVHITRILREIAESDVRDAEGNILIQPGLKVKHKKSGLEYSVKDVVDDGGKVKIVLNVPEVPRVQPTKTLPSVVTEKDVPTGSEKEERLSGILDTLDKEEQTVFVVDEKEFERKYEVR